MPTPAHNSFRQQKIRIGDHLLAAKLITQEQLDQALAQQKITKRRLGYTLVELNMIDEDLLLRFLSRQLNIDYVDLKKFTLEPDIVKIIPEIQARRFRIIALAEDDGVLSIGMADPTDVYAFDEITRLLKRPFNVAIVKESILLKAIDKLYRHTEKIKDLAEEVDLQLGTESENQDLADTEADYSDAPLIQLLNTMIEDAVSINVSDIHIEPELDNTRIRFRVDGLLHEQPPASRRLANALISRLKLMAGLDISEKRLPQDGRFRLMVRNQHIDIRLSTMPMQHGETAVMRLLNQSAGIPGLDDIGMDPTTLTRFRKAIHSPHGIVLVTGPTGSGKTTTLYAALMDINNPGKKIITVEDPVEYQIPGITQVQVNPKIDLDFARVLRSLLRQDPDIALVGEMRDNETMETALRTAMTGHLVLSTLHTNDAVSTVSRLIDMGAPPFMLASSLRGILAQRLIRLICNNCATPAELSDSQKTLASTTLGDTLEKFSFKHSNGCPHCNNTGYMGRTSVSEFIEMNDTLLEPLQKGDLQDFTHQANLQTGYQSIAKSAFKLAARGITSFDEVMRVCFGGI